MLKEQDEPKGLQDVLSDEETTSGKKPKATSKKDTGKSFTPEEIAKIKSDAKAEEGRRWKAVEVERDQFKGEVGTLNTRLEDIEGRVSANAYEEAKKDTTGTALARVQAETALRERERKAQDRENAVTRGEAQLKADKELFTDESGSTIVSTIATKHGIDSEKLAAYGITDKDTLDKIAADLPKLKPEDKSEGEKSEGDADSTEGVFTPTSDTPSGTKPVDLTVKGVEETPMAELQQAITPKIK